MESLFVDLRTVPLLSVLAVAGALLPACGSDRAGSEGGSGVFDDPPVPVPEACARSETTAERPPVDVILPIDSSSSMGEEIKQVQENLNRLSAFLDATGLDYRVITLGTTGKRRFDVCIPPPLGGENCGSNGTVYRAVSVNVGSWDALTTILRTLNAPEGEPWAWRDFLRPNAVKVFVPVTDDNSIDIGSALFDYELLAKPGGLFGTEQSRRYVFYPIVGAAPYPSRKECGGSVQNSGFVYLELAELTGGKWLPLCAPSFGPLFEEIGRNVADVLACELPVPSPPNGEQIDHGRVNVKITAGGESVEILQDTSKACTSGADGWQYNADRTKIILCGPPCASIRADNASKVSVLFGCKTRVR